MISLAGYANAQNTLVTNTLIKAKQLRNEKRFSEAVAVLGNFEKKYPGDIRIERIYAQTLFWLKDYRRAEVIYKRAIGFHPENMDVRYEYAIMLFAENKLDQAKEQLLVYTRNKQDNAGAASLLGRIFYYQSQFKNAEKYLGRAVQLNPNDKGTEELYREVFRIISPQLLLSAEYKNDDQPLQSFGSALKFQWYVSDLLDFDVSGDASMFTKIPNTGLISSAGIGNHFNFRKAGLELRLAGSWFYANSDKTYDWGGTVQLDKRFKKSFRIALKAERTNYTYTIASVDNNLLMINQFSLNFTAGKAKSWNGMAGARYQFFPDNNYVNAFYAWFLSRPINLSGFKLSFGYAFNYMDSKEDRFVSKDVGARMISGNNGSNQSTVVDGIYVPYYTPHNQYANSVLVNFNFHVTPYVVFYGHASVGVYSKTNAPGFSLSNNGTLEKTFAYQSYTPLDLGLSFLADISRKTELNLSYSYLQTYYYNGHNVNFGFRFYF
ncbi:MAG: tetratricopeptide repeat protein [Chlorobi bacterium]|nr:tetratricopeptide repeat protein [Chlorobiota bacterium]